MFEFVKMQLALGRLTLEQAKAFVGTWLTQEEYDAMVYTSAEEQAKIDEAIANGTYGQEESEDASSEESSADSSEEESVAEE